MSVEFANELAVETGLKISSVGQPTGNRFLDEAIHVYFSCPEDITITAGLLVDQPINVFFITINGNIDSPTTKRIAEKAVNLFLKKYPDGKIIPYTRYETLLGP